MKGIGCSTSFQVFLGVQKKLERRPMLMLLKSIEKIKHSMTVTPNGPFSK